VPPVSLATPGASIETPAAALEAPAAARRFRFVADAFVDHQIGRSWSARTAYRRGLSYVEGLAGPAYTNSASVETAGFVNRRVDLLFSAAYATGQMAAPTVAAAQFATYTANTRLRVALSHDFAAYVEGLFYEYSFDPDLIVTPGLPDHFKRSGVRTGITMWLPMRSDHRAAR
jgi:hypothetical protein